MPKLFSKALFGAIMVAVLAFAAPAIAGSLAILDDLKSQNASVSMLDQNTLDSTRAKAVYYLTMSKPSTATGGEWFEFYNKSYNLLHTAYYSRATAMRQGDTSNPTIERYVVDAASPGWYNEVDLVTIDRSTGWVTVYNSERVMDIGYRGLGALGLMTNIPGWGQAAYLPMSTSTISPTRIVLQ